jgi:hypothetical protein
MHTLLICEVPCRLFKDCFRTRVYCLGLLVVARLVLLIIRFPLERVPVTITTCPGVISMYMPHPLNRFGCFRVMSLWPPWCCPEMDAWRNVWHLARARLRGMNAGDGSECLSSPGGGSQGTWEDSGTPPSPWEFSDIESSPWETSRAPPVAHC